LGSGQSRIEILQSLGLKDIQIAPQLSIEDGIQAVRMFIKTAWFDAEKTERGVEALRQYQRDWDDKGKTWRSRPKHDFTSHAADSLRYLVTGYKPTSDTWGKPLRRGLKGVV
jgi:hypothetical protein